LLANRVARNAHRTQLGKQAVAPIDSRKCIVLQGLTHFGSVVKRSVSFRNFPKLSVSFRPFALGSVWSPTFPGLSRRVLRTLCSRPGFRALFQTKALLLLFASFAAQNSEYVGGQGLTDFGAVPKLSVSFRNFPKLSVSFRFFPVRFLLLRRGAGALKSRRQEDFGREHADNCSRMDGL